MSTVDRESATRRTTDMICFNSSLVPMNSPRLAFFDLERAYLESSVESKKERLGQNRLHQEIERPV